MKTSLFYIERNTKYYMRVQSIVCIFKNKEQLAKANCFMQKRAEKYWTVK
ncbi:hypothetical protein bthur0003_37600 [Bacillus thuringiensis serovar thuringiensis str. T01001]|nr:hypothetical protein H175_ch1847 [Bacillus thuringiensis serovar thuringiensis str. IS5056]EEM33736.1 hypothetical protein bthur0003_37600 [Bacillus thuringiensis serovar thuringiensis str. T01001]